MKKILALLLASLLVAGVLTACGQSASSAAPASTAPASSTAASESSAPAESAASGEKSVIGMAMIDHTNAGFVGIKTGADAAAEDYNCELIWKSCGGNLDTQIDQIRGFIQQQVDVIMIDSVDVNGVKPVVDEATAAGVQVLAIGSPIDGKENYSATYPDYIDSTFAAKVLGEVIYKDQTGTIILVAAAPGNSVSDNRQKGFEDAMKAYPNLKVVTILGEWSADVAMTKTEEALRANNDVIHIHVIQDGMSYGVLRAVQASGKEIPISSNDGDPEGLANFDNGDYIMENLNGAKRIGYWFVALCDFIAKGEPMARVQYDTTYKVLREEDAAQVLELGLDVVDGNQMTIVTSEEAAALAEDYRNEFAPGEFTPTP